MCRLLILVTVLYPLTTVAQVDLTLQSGPGATTRQMVGGVLPLSNDGLEPDGIEQTYPLPHADMADENTVHYGNGAGYLPLCLDGTVTTTLRGLYVTIEEGCGDVIESSDGPLLDLGFAPSGDATNCEISPGSSAGNTRAARTAFYHANSIMALARGHLPDNDWLTQPLPVRVNVNINCAASGGPNGLNFYREGGGCANTGEIASVIVHEWSHGMDGVDASPGASNPAEGIADVYAALRLNTSCVGRNFRPGVNCGGYGDPCVDCDGIRDVDWRNRASGTPHDVQWADITCGSGGISPCGGSIHCEGAIVSEALWDLYRYDLPAAGMDLDTARELVIRLTLIGGGSVSQWFQCDIGFGGCNADGGYLNYLAADDDNGNLQDGTPHMEQIYAAFNRHGIACDTLTVQNSGCTPMPLDQPVVSITPIDHGAQLSWAAVTNAQRYRIYRSEGVPGCGQGKTLIATTGNTAYNDEELMNGFTYYYTVIPIGLGDSCFGPASECQMVTPQATANFALGQIENLSIEGGDGDAFLDNCEVATLTFTIYNSGNSQLSNLRFNSITSPSHPKTNILTDDQALIAASVAPGCTVVNGTLMFEARELTFDDTLVLAIGLTADELGGRIIETTYTIRSTQSDLRSYESLSFQFETDLENWRVSEGTFLHQTPDGANGSAGFLASSSGIPDSCDVIESPVLTVSPTSTLALYTRFEIEPGTPWYDRANLAVIAADGSNRRVIIPDGGRPYNASGSQGNDFCTNGEEGYAGSETEWAESTWSTTALGSADLNGELLRLQVTYGTDAGLQLAGFQLDAVTLTDVMLQEPDQQNSSCSCLITLQDWPARSVLDLVTCLDQIVFPE